MALPGLPASIEAKLRCQVVDGDWEPVDYMAARSEDDLRYALTGRKVLLSPAGAWYMVGAEDGKSGGFRLLKSQEIPGAESPVRI